MKTVLDLSGIPEVQRLVLAEASRVLKQQGAQGFLVGGFIRDCLRGLPSDDLDLVVDGIEPARLARHLARTLGLAGPVVFQRFKTVLVVGRGVQVEICRLAGGLERDASRRDFTVNCLYIDLAAYDARAGRAALTDPTGAGMRDLEGGALVTPGEAHFTLWLDPLRMMRAVRFYSAWGFNLDPQLVRAMDRTAYLLSRVAAERIRMELERILVSTRLASSLGLMLRTGVLDVVLPELRAAHGFCQGTPYHAYDLYTHLVKTASRMPADPLLRLAGLLHDLGKLKTQVPKQDRMVYYGHEEVSARDAAVIMTRLKFPKRSTKFVVFLVGNHMINYSSDWSDRAVRRFTRKAGANLGPLLDLAEADRRAQRPGSVATRLLRELRGRIEGLDKAACLGTHVPLDGLEIMELLGIREGPLVGRAKDFLAEEALKKGRPMGREEAAETLTRWSRAGGGPVVRRPTGRRSVGVDNSGRA
jgi:putative nucleotidyltransferase with HDIG domain